MSYYSCRLFIEFNYFFFFNDTATTEIYTLSLHDALPICCLKLDTSHDCGFTPDITCLIRLSLPAASMAWTISSTADRKSTRLNSSHTVISYAVFCLKKKKKSIYVSHCE